MIVNLPRFGDTPDTSTQSSYSHYANYYDAEFHNQIATPVLKEGLSMWSVMWSNLTAEPVNELRPESAIPARQIDFKALDKNQDVLVWLGHSAFYIQMGGKRILIDPVFSDHASPFSFMVKAFTGTTLFNVEDLPDIDVLLISHDHWDHLDYPTAVALQAKVKTAFVPLGIGAHLQRWGYPQAKIHEANWYEQLPDSEGVSIHLVPARHYSGRGLSRNQSLWGGFVLEAHNRRLLLSGDSGYGPHFKEIGERFKSFDLVALDSGQYDPRWPYIHMTPQEAAQVANEIHAKALLPIHAGRFALARHPWKQPFENSVSVMNEAGYQLYTPIIGQLIDLQEAPPEFSHWWKNVD